MPLLGLLPLPRLQALRNGVFAPGALANFYAAGALSRLDTYSNADGLTAHKNANPVVADASGLFGPIYLQPQAYKLILTTSTGANIYTQDNIEPVSASNLLSYGFLATDWPGVIGDGSNITTAVQALANAGYKHLHFPAGTYGFGEVDWSNVSMITGDGPGATAFVATGVIAPNNTLFRLTSTSNFTMRDCQISISLASYPTVIGIYLYQARYAFLQNIYMPHAGKFGIWGPNCFNVEVDHCIINDYGDNGKGIVFDGSSSNRINIRSCDVVQPAPRALSQHGIALHDGQDMHADDCYAELTGGFGICIPDAAGSSVTNCRTNNTHDEGIAGSGPNSEMTDNIIYWPPSGSIGTDFGMSCANNQDSMIIARNTIIRSQKSGIAVDGIPSNPGVGQYLNIFGNRIQDCCQLGEAGTLASGIRLYGGSAIKNRIHDNIITDSTGKMLYGVAEVVSTTNPDINTYYNNQIEGNALVANYALLGPSSLILAPNFKGTTLACANNLTLPVEGDTFVLSGNTNINLISVNNQQEGKMVTFLFSGTPTIINNHAPSGVFHAIILEGGSDYIIGVGFTLTLRLISGSWQEVSRKS